MKKIFFTLLFVLSPFFAYAQQAVTINLGLSPVSVSNPFPENLTQLNSVSLGSPTSWGTTPSGNVLGVNADVLNTVSVTGSVGISGALPAFTNSSTVTIGKVDILGNAGGTLDTAAGTSASTLLSVQGSASGVPIPTATAASAANGASVYTAQGGTTNTLLTATAVSVKSSAGTVYSFNCNNQGSAAAYVQFFNTASVTLGTTAPVMVEWIPAGGAADQLLAGDVGEAFSTAIYVAATTTPTGSTAPSTGIACNIAYK